MKTLKLILLIIWCLLVGMVVSMAQTQVLKIDSLERQKIESFTDQNTFPDLIRFIKDLDGNYIVGFEILRDLAYEKIGRLNSRDQPLREFIEIHSDTIIYKPKTETETVEKFP
jgi:glutaredoxin-related protein